MECSGSTVAVLRDNMDRAVGYKADFLTLTLHPNPNRNANPTRP